MASLKAKKIKPLGTSPQSGLSHRQLLCILRMGMWNGAHCRYKQCYLYSVPTLCQLGRMKKQHWESNPDLPHGTAETPIPGANPGNVSPVWESKRSSIARAPEARSTCPLPNQAQETAPAELQQKMKYKLIPSPFPPVG